MVKNELPNLLVSQKMNYPTHFSSVPTRGINSERSLIFHNLTGYDSHIFIKNLGVTEGLINCIPNSEEKYISFIKDIEEDRYMEKDKKNWGNERKNCKERNKIH